MRSLLGSGGRTLILRLFAAARLASGSVTGTLDTMTKYSTRRRDVSSAADGGADGA